MPQASTTNDEILKSVLVTGAARRIGRAIALDLAAGGWTVAVHFNRSEAEARAVVDEISAAGGSAASVTAAYRGHSDIAVGNVVGSNLFNILGIAGLAAMVTPLPVAASILSFDIWVMGGATVLLLLILVGRWHPRRGSAAFFLILYGAYIGANGYGAGLFGG